MLSARAILILGLCLPAIAAATGCTAPLPTYPRMPDDAALRVIADRLDQVRTVSAAADITLTASDGRRVRLDGAFIATPPNRARLRAWKFGTPVLDLTVLPDGVWVYTADPPGQADGNRQSRDLSRLPAASIAPALELLAGAYFRRAHTLQEESTAETFAVIGPALGRQGIGCDIDRATLTPRRFQLVATRANGELLLDHYTMFNSIAWPRSIRFRSAEGEVLVRLYDLELNTDLPPEAFTPPGRARLLP